MKNKLKLFLAVLLILILSLGSLVTASANEAIDEEANEATDENFFTSVYIKIGEYASEILCALTLAGSLVVAFAYKKGLLPLIEKTLITLGSAVGKIKESTDKSAEKNDVLEATVKKKLTEASELLASLAERTEKLDLALSEKLAGENEMQAEKESLRLILSAQIDMLYDLFMSSALPQYQKDAVGERIAQMKEAIVKNDVKE